MNKPTSSVRMQDEIAPATPLLDHLINAYAVFCAAAFYLVADYFLHDLIEWLHFFGPVR